MYYVGSTSDIEARLIRHNSGYVPSTRNFRPWVIVWFESSDSPQNAMRREKQIKSRKSRNYIETLIANFHN